MPLSWDERVVPRAQQHFVQRVQELAPCRLAGGAVLSGVHLKHRLSRDLDIFCDDRQSVRGVLRVAQDTAEELSGRFQVVRDGGTFVRAVLTLGEQRLEVDIAHEPSEPLAPRTVVEGIVVDALDDLRANKLTCLLSRSEPRDLVDLYFLDQAGLPAETSLEAALKKDAGVDPGILSMLLLEFPTAPLPLMLRELNQPQLDAFRLALSERFKVVALPAPT